MALKTKEYAHVISVQPVSTKMYGYVDNREEYYYIIRLYESRFICIHIKLI